MLKRLNKSQVINLVGKYSWRDGNILVAPIKYIKGIDSVNDLVKSGKINKKNNQFTFEKRPKGLTISTIMGFSKLWIAIKYENIVYWSLIHQEEIIETKSKSVVGRALVGGILLGPLGAVVGGVSGIGDKKRKISDVDNILSIGYSNEEDVGEIYFSCSNKHYEKTLHFFKKSYPEKMENSMK